MSAELPGDAETASGGGSIAGDPGRLFVVVLGAHRSGTSLCAHVLSALGIDMADDPTPQPSNPKGHWERWEIVEFHDRILDLFNRGYRTPLHDLPMPPGWWADPRVGDIKSEITAFLARRMGVGVPFGFKDPRAARLLRLWQPIFAELDRQVKIVVCLRNPAQVARSLYERDGLPLDMGEYRWFTYMAEIFGNLGNNYCAIEYETWFDGTGGNAAKLVKFLGLDPAGPGGTAAATGDIVDRQLRHDDAGLQLPRQPLIRAFYGAVRRLGTDAAARMQVARMVHQFNQFGELQRWLASEFEALSRVAAGSARLVPVDGGPPIVSWRVPGVIEPAGTTPHTPDAADDIAAAAAPNSPAAGSSGSPSGMPVFVRYDPVSTDAQALMLWYRDGEPSAKSVTERTLQVSLRWFDSRGRVLVWESSRVAFDLSESGDWRQASVDVPPFPSATPWLRFDIFAADHRERGPLCTGFLFSGSNGQLPSEIDAPVLAYTHAPRPALLPDDSAPSSGASMPADEQSSNGAAAARSTGRGMPFLIDTALCEMPRS